MKEFNIDEFDYCNKCELVDEFKATKEYSDELQERINKLTEFIELKIKRSEEQERLIRSIVTPQNGYLLHEAEREIDKYKTILEILEGESNE